MARNERESAYPTLWQLEALRVAAESESWAEATERLGVDSKHQVLRTVARLSAKLGIQHGLLIDRDDRPYVPEPLSPLVADLRAVLAKWDDAKMRVSETERSYFLRLDGYWSQIENFAGPVITTFKPTGDWRRTRVKIELIPEFGYRREHGGAGMIAELLPPNPRVDAVIAPDDEPADPDGVTSRALYRWCLVAAIHKGHPLTKRVVDGTIDVDDLTGQSLAASPARHRTRDLLDIHQSSYRRFDVSLVSPEPAALVAMGHESDYVPIVASDSSIPMGPWLGSKSARTARATRLPPWWPAIRTSDYVLGGAYRLFWRTDNRPYGMPYIIEQLAERLREAAVDLDHRVEVWWDDLPTAIRD